MTQNKRQINRISQHENSYIHIPRIPLRWLLWLLLDLVIGILCWLNLYLVDWKFIKIIFSSEETIKAYSFQTSQLINIYPLIGEYILLSLFVITLYKAFKGKLKRWNEEGLIMGLIAGLVWGLIFGFIFGFIFGLVGVLIGGLIAGLIFGFIFGFIFGLIFGFIFGLIAEGDEK